MELIRNWVQINPFTFLGYSVTQSPGMWGSRAGREVALSGGHDGLSASSTSLLAALPWGWRLWPPTSPGGRGLGSPEFSEWDICPKSSQNLSRQ